MSSDDENLAGQHPASEPSADEVCAAPPVASPAREKPSTRDMILERRSRFIAAALAGAGLASAGCAQACLSLAGPGDAGGAAPCLSITGPQYNTGLAGTGGTSGAGGVPPIFAIAGAQACLSPPAGGAAPFAGSAGYSSAGAGPLAGGAGGVGGMAPVTGGTGPIEPPDSPDAGESEDGGL